VSLSAEPNKLRGVLPVFQTPYEEDETIDYATLEKEVDWLYEHGADGIVMAMVSEVLRLSSEEREQLTEYVCRSNADRGAVIISVGAESSHTAERYARHADAVGADAVMAIPPLSVALDEGELLKYYRRIIEAVRIPMIVQDASGYVGRPMPITMQVVLLDEYGPQRVMYKPEAPPIGPKLTQLRDASGGRARAFEGTGGLALVDSYRRGVVGTMPGTDLTDGLVALWRALEANDERQIYELSLPISSLIAIQTSLDAFLAIEKYLLVKQGVFKNTIIRGPVQYHLDEETRQEVDRLFDRLIQAVKSTDVAKPQ